ASCKAGRGAARRRPEAPRRAGRARDRLGRIDPAARGWPLDAQSLRHEGGRFVAGGPGRGAVPRGCRRGARAPACRPSRLCAQRRSTHNPFGMEAGASWQGARAGAGTLEVVDGVPERRRAGFRAYASIAESFMDYADVIERLPRYADALHSAEDAEAYARAVA